MAGVTAKRRLLHISDGSQEVRFDNLAAERAMEKHLGDLAEPYRSGKTSTPAKAAKGLLAAGAALGVAGRRRPALARAGALATLAGVALTRWSIFKAGFESAEDPRFTVQPQRERWALTH